MFSFRDISLHYLNVLHIKFKFTDSYELAIIIIKRKPKN